MIKLRLKLDELLKEHNISQSKLSQLIEVRQATLSDMSRNARSEINIPIIEKKLLITFPLKTYLD